MFGVLIVAAIFSLPHSSIAIIGGRSASIRKFHYVVSFQAYNQYVCGGVLLKPNIALTTASCVTYAPGALLTVHGESLSAEQGGKSVKVAKAVMHPEYNSKTLSADVAILHLERSMDIGAAPALARGAVPDGTRVTIAGFGSVVKSPSKPFKTLMQATTVIRNPCPADYRGLDSKTVKCFGSNGVGQCVGDEGGPIVVGTGTHAKLAGLIIGGNGCDSSKIPGIFTDLSSQIIKNFIQKEMK